MRRLTLPSMNFKRWFWNDDTARWKGATTMFLLVTTAIVLIVLMVLLVWFFWSKGTPEGTP